MRLHRPYIPVAVRLLVAQRQYCEKMGVGFLDTWRFQNKKSDTGFLKAMLGVLFEGPCELHHRPALMNRKRYIRNGKVFYDPPANSAEHLIYLAADEHDIETRVRGVGAQRSDLSQGRYLKKVAKNRAKQREKVGRNRTKRGEERPRCQHTTGRRSPSSGTAREAPVKLENGVAPSRSAYRWPKRPLRSASKWPKRKFRS